MNIKKNPTGIYSVTFKTEHGRRTISTGATSLDEAKEVVKQAKIKELEIAAKATKLSREVISQVMAGKSVTVAEAVKEWGEWMHSVGENVTTAACRLDYVQRWMRDKKVASTQVNAVTAKHIHSWINRPESKLKLASRKSVLTSLSSFFKWATAKGYTLTNPAALVKVDMRLLSHEQKEGKARQPFTDEEVAALLDWAKHLRDEAKWVWRDRPERSKRQITEYTRGFWYAAIAIARCTGLRLGDICQLEWSSLADGKFVCWTDKRDMRVEPPISDPETFAAAIAGIERRSAKYLFPDERNIIHDIKRRSYLSGTFLRICELYLGIKGKSFHDLRASYVTEMDRKGIPIEHIARSVGHRDIVTTQGYIKRQD